VVQVTNKEPVKAVNIFSGSDLTLDCACKEIKLYNYGKTNKLMLDFSESKENVSKTCVLSNMQGES
jgi:hypothetical protein